MPHHVQIENSFSLFLSFCAGTGGAAKYKKALKVGEQVGWEDAENRHSYKKKCLRPRDPTFYARVGVLGVCVFVYLYRFEVPGTIRLTE